MKLVILDRDGTINRDSDDYIKSPEEWQALPGALEGIARLTHAGWRIVIASNQSGLGRGLFDMAALNAMHAKLNKQLDTMGGRIDAVFYCPHTPDDKCRCRKPCPGFLSKSVCATGCHSKVYPHAVTPCVTWWPVPAPVASRIWS